MFDILGIKKTGKVYLLMCSYVLSIVIAGVVYATGGTSKVYANLMYLPIAINASINGKKYGMILAGISAFIIGPFMPLNSELNIMQKPVNWMLRLVIYLLISFVIGFFADYYKKQAEINGNKDKEISEARMATIYALVKLAEFRDEDTGSHVERMAEYSKLLATKLHNKSKYKSYVNKNYINNIHKASTLHDIGKVGIPDRILLKPGKLTNEEFETMKTHTLIGANTILDVKKKYPENKFLELGLKITRFHHEKWDGSGYPYGLCGEKIPLSARIVAIADVYDALRSERVYKKAFSHEKSVNIIKQGKGTHFDPFLVDVFVENDSEFKIIFDNL